MILSGTASIISTRSYCGGSGTDFDKILEVISRITSLLPLFEQHGSQIRIIQEAKKIMGQLEAHFKGRLSVQYPLLNYSSGLPEPPPRPQYDSGPRAVRPFYNVQSRAAAFYNTANILILSVFQAAKVSRTQQFEELKAHSRSILSVAQSLPTKNIEYSHVELVFPLIVVWRCCFSPELTASAKTLLEMWWRKGGLMSICGGALQNMEKGMSFNRMVDR